MNGRFGVFDGIFLIAEFGNDEDADEYMRKTVLQEDEPEHLRRTEYDNPEVREIPEDYAAHLKLLYELKASLREDRQAAAAADQESETADAPTRV
jgi:hypothetical protein